MPPIKYGVVGTGWITDSWIRAAAKTGSWQLHAVYSRTADQAQSFAAKHDIPKLYTDLDQLAADDALQVVYIGSPNSLHHAQAKACLQAGKHVLLEKPATSTVAELDELFQLARAHRVILIEAYRHIHEANFKRLQQLVRQENRLGPIYGASLQYASYSSRYNDMLDGWVPNVFNLDFSGGALVDVGVYPVLFCVALFGAPQSQTYAPFICASGVDGGGMALLRYPTFAVQINISKCYASAAPCEIYGERGTLTVNAATDIRTIRHWDPRTKQTEELAGPYKTVDKPDVNMEEEAAEFARIIDANDTGAVEALEELSKIVLRVTTDLRRQGGIVYPADSK